ncbi:hypothetical protein ACFL02_02940 [Planctomycetota bacterium]
MATNKADKNTWRAYWQDGKLLGPDGQPYAPVWNQRPDVEIGHELLDRWQKKLGLVDLVPHINQWSFWWEIRFGLLHLCLVNLLPQLRLLQQIRQSQRTIPLKIVLPQVQESWSADLFKTVFPESKIVIASRPPSRSLSERIQRGAIRAWRSWDAHQRLQRLGNPDPGKPRVLVVSRDRTWTGEYDSELGAVIEAMKSAGLDVVVLVLAASGRPDQKFQAHRTRPPEHIWEDLVYVRHLLYKGYPHPPKWKMPSKGFMVNGCDLSMVFGKMVRAWKTRRFQQYYILAETFPEVARIIGAQAAVLTDENCGCQGLKMGLMRAGIPTIGVQHGVIHPHHMAYIYPKDIDPSCAAICDYTCVYGDYERDILVKQSIYSESSVVVTGQVQMDHRSIANRQWGKRGEKGDILREKYLPPGCDRLLFFTSQSVYRSVTTSALLISLARSHPRNFLVVRPHPSEIVEPFWKNAIKSYDLENRVIVQEQGALDDWLDACDIHISATSTVLSEAAAFGRGNIIIGAQKFGDWMGCLPESVAVALEDFDSLDQAISYWLERPEYQERNEANRRRYIKQHFYHLDGQAGARIAAVVEKALSGKKLGEK